MCLVSLLVAILCLVLYGLFCDVCGLFSVLCEFPYIIWYQSMAWSCSHKINLWLVNLKIIFFLLKTENSRKIAICPCLCSWLKLCYCCSLGWKLSLDLGVFYLFRVFLVLDFLFSNTLSLDLSELERLLLVLLLRFQNLKIVGVVVVDP